VTGPERHAGAVCASPHCGEVDDLAVLVRRDPRDDERIERREVCSFHRAWACGLGFVVPQERPSLLGYGSGLVDPGPVDGEVEQ
jgi:hypothetical protein